MLSVVRTTLSDVEQDPASSKFSTAVFLTNVNLPGGAASFLSFGRVTFSIRSTSAPSFQVATTFWKVRPRSAP